MCVIIITVPLLSSQVPAGYLNALLSLIGVMTTTTAQSCVHSTVWRGGLSTFITNAMESCSNVPLQAGVHMVVGELMKD